MSDQFAELSSAINELNDSCSVVDRMARALLEVVKLHAPTKTGFCQICERVYPCATALTIKKELD